MKALLFAVLIACGGNPPVPESYPKWCELPIEFSRRCENRILKIGLSPCAICYYREFPITNPAFVINCYDEARDVYCVDIDNGGCDDGACKVGP